MHSGIYSVEFRSNLGIPGSGLVVIDGKRINGGDNCYIYQGHLNVNGEEMRATIRVSHYQGPMFAIFGQVPQFSLELSGTIKENGTFSLNGKVDENPQLKIFLTGRKVAGLV